MNAHGTMIIYGSTRVLALGRGRVCGALLSAWICLVSGAVLGQSCLTIEWDVTIGGSDVDLVRGAAVMPDGNYILVGSTNSPASGEVSEAGYGLYDAWAVCLDPDGSIVWERRYGGLAGEGFLDVAITPDGGLLFLGHTASPVSGLVSQPPFSSGSTDYWVVRCDASGNVLWDRRFGGTGVEEGRSIIARSDGSFLLGGYSDSPVSGNKMAVPRGGYDYWVIAIDEDGSKLWDAGFGGSNADLFEGMAKRGVGGAVLTGSSFSGPTGDISEARRGLQDIWSVAIDASGGILWEKRHGGSEQDIPFAGITSVGNEFFIAGQSNSPASLDLTLPGLGFTDALGLWVSGADGALAFETRAGGSDIDGGRSVAALNPASATSNVAIAGATSSPVSGTISGIPRGGYDYWLTIQTLNNTVAGQFRCGTDQLDEVRKVLITPDGGYLLAGMSGADAGWDKTHNSRGGDFDLWVVKVHATSGDWWFADADGDGFGTPSLSVFGCEPPPGYVRSDRDCDDTDPLKYTGAPCVDGGSPSVLGPDCVCGSAVGGVTVPVVMGLQGPMDSFTGLMDDGLHINGLLPLAEPYAQLGFNVTENQGAQMDPALLQVNGSTAIVDWVLVELRHVQSPATVIASRAGLLRRDGLVVALDGTPFRMDAPADWYYVVVRHRNHLGIMSASPVELSMSTPMAGLLFASPQTPVFGNDPQAMVGNSMCLWGGDTDGDGQLRYTGGGNDRDHILQAIGSGTPTGSVSGYLPEDLNLDGDVKYTGAGNDRDIILFNIGGTVPTNVRVEQLP